MNSNVATEVDWQQLLSAISDKQLIPIIGGELFTFQANGKAESLDNFLSKKLLEDNNLQQDESLSLPDAVELLRKEKNLLPKDINKTLRENTEMLSQRFPLLEKFFSIDLLSFYLNTTVYDNIIANTIKKVRNQQASAIDFSIRSRFKDCDDIEDLEAPLLFNVFGSFKSADPAVTEEEMLEFTASFQEKMNVYATSVLDALKNKTLLFLGCTNPEWLVRFLVRVVSNERIQDWAKRNSQIMIVNDQSNFRQKQYDFLKSHNAVTYAGNTNDFVEELSTRWKMKHPNQANCKTVFLSYSKKDAEAVERLKQTLTVLNNVVCWYDKEKLHSGDNFKKVITENIKNADLFIPLISQNSLQNEDSYV
ncbi:MAG: toll/interleukin-1 receptor domain-containing protein, partial [Bacteroidota bacterium]|nr:toll/interleukin-1 receptor domain-containing protein [Bacteroidota bacterium]